MEKGSLGVVQARTINAEQSTWAVLPLQGWANACHPYVSFMHLLPIHRALYFCLCTDQKHGMSQVTAHNRKDADRGRRWEKMQITVTAAF